ncbi:hypothetical protein ACFFHC_11060 [Kytococcus schroeteri]|uniref:hypothetical protein n=1 Tax=Kytococcus schroeteri TaxID=138300 RepID=UPI0011450EF4
MPACSVWGWATPLGWVDQARAFGDARWWPVGLLLVTATFLVAAAVALHARRNVDAALLRARPRPDRASSLLRTPFGLALHEHRGALLGWTLGPFVLVAAGFAGFRRRDVPRG